jgi:hypothetical protein
MLLVLWTRGGERRVTLTNGARGAAELAEPGVLQLAVDEEDEVPRDHCAEAQPLRDLGTIRRRKHAVAMIDELAAGFAAGVEARVAARALAVEREQAKALGRCFRRRLTARPDPAFERRLADQKQLIGETIRRLGERRIRHRDHRVEPFGRRRHLGTRAQMSPRS